MRFWSSLLVCLVVIAGIVAGGTWLVMHQGAQALPESYSAPKASGAAKMVFEGGLRMLGNVIEFDAGEAKIDEPKKFSVPFRNAGDAPLRLRFLRVSCGCKHEVRVDGRSIEINEEIVKQPGERGEITLHWTITKDCKRCKHGMVFAVAFLANDPRPRFLNGFRIEVKTKPIKPAKTEKPAS